MALQPGQAGLIRDELASGSLVVSPFELVTLLLIPEIPSEALNAGEAFSDRAILGATTLLSLFF